MRYIIDTNIFIRLATDKDLLSKDVINILEDYDNVICLSVITLGEPLISSDRKFEFYRHQGLDFIYNRA